MSEKQTPVKELTLQEAQDEIKPLRAKLTKWGKEYYEQDNPTVEDHVYDRAYQRLVQLEEQFPQLVSADSPSRRSNRKPINKSSARNSDVIDGGCLFD